MFVRFAILVISCLAATTQPAEVRRGQFTASFTDQSPLSPIEAQNKRHHIKVEDAHRYRLADESFEIYVPEDYDPDRPWGILVWISAMESGRPHTPYLPLLSQHQLIWIGANNSGNERGVGVRFGLALDAVYNLKQLYNIDESRIYVSGISGGGKVATMLAIIYPEVFTGSIPIVGTTYFRHIPLPNEKNKYWPGMFEKPPASTLDRAKRDGRFVLITGSKDFNRDPIKATYEEGFVKDGFAQVEYVEVEGMDHEMAGAERFERAIEFLDAPLESAAKDHWVRAQQLERDGKLGDAQKLYAQVAAHGSDELVNRAEDKLANLLRSRDEQMIQAQRLAEERKFVEAARVVSRLIEQFGATAPAEAGELLEKLRADPAAAAQIAASEQKIRQEQRESQAAAQLDAARKLIPRDLRAAYASLLKITKDFPETQSAMQAQHEAENLLADPGNRRLLETDPSEEAAAKLLLLAQNYERNKLYKEAAERCERILRDYPNTKAAAMAKEMLGRLKRD